MSACEAVLSKRVDTAYRKLTAARQAGQDGETEQHGGLLEDLFEIAQHHGLDATSWNDLGGENRSSEPALTIQPARAPTADLRRGVPGRGTPQELQNSLTANMVGF